MNLNDKRAAYLKELIQIKGYNPRSLSLAIGTNPTLVRDFIERNTESPTLRTFDKIAEILGVPVNDLVNATSNSGVIHPEVSALLTQLDIEIQKQLIPQLKGLLDAQQGCRDET